MSTSPQPAPVVVVGAGVSGVACTRALTAAGIGVRLLDRGRRAGGRMASRTQGERSVDLGASYFTVSDPVFEAVAHDWRDRGLAREWTDSFTVLAPGSAPEDKPGPVRWGATPSLRALVEDLVDGAAEVTTEHTVASVRREGRAWSVDGVEARAVVLAMPDPQALRLLGPDAGSVRDRLVREWEPVLALAARWPARTWDDLSPSGRFHGAFVNDDEVLAFVADDGRRRGDDAPVLVAHSTPDFARGHLEDPEQARAPMLAALVARLGVADPAESLVHRWTFARPTGERPGDDGADHLLEDGLGVCGDGWGPTSKVETAWLSGHRLGIALAEQLAGEPDA